VAKHSVAGDIAQLQDLLRQFGSQDDFEAWGRVCAALAAAPQPVKADPVHLVMAREVKADSWVRDYPWFIKAHSYASCKTNAIYGLAVIRPDDLFYVFTFMLRGLGYEVTREGHVYPIDEPQPVKAEQKESDPRQICKRCGEPAGLRGTGRDLCDACWDPYAHGVLKMNKSGGGGDGNG